MPDLVNSGSITVVDGTSGVNPPAGSYLDIGVEDHPAVSIDLEGTFVATLVIEATTQAGPGQANWFPALVQNAAGVTVSGTLTAPGRRFVNTAGVERLRLRCTGFTSGAPTATLRAGQGIVAPAARAVLLNQTVNYAAAQTNTVLVANTAGTTIIVTSFLVTLSNAVTVNVPVGIGLAQTVTPPSGTANRFGSHPNLAPGSGFGRTGGDKDLAVGADGDQVLVTLGVPTGGSADCSVTYYLVSS